MFKGKEGLLGMQVIGSGHHDDVGRRLLDQAAQIIPGAGLGVQLLQGLHVIDARVKQARHRGPAPFGRDLDHVASGAAATGQQDRMRTHGNSPSLRIATDASLSCTPST